MVKILIGIPTYDRRIDVEILKSALFIERLNKYHLDFVFPISSHLAKNRNYCVKEFLSGNYDYLLFWDSDIILPQEDFIQKMLDTGFKLSAQIICGAYRMKGDENKYVLANKNQNADTYSNFSKATKAQLIDAGGTGIMLINREVLERMEDPWFTILDGKNLFCMPEDFEFCRKAQEKGFKIAVEPGFTTSHIGTHFYTHV